ncbi:NAD(P)/FAD-dependent oxidoreductase [Leucobacter sp. GX24907]
MRTADAVVIGGGCIGTSTLYHLVRMGIADVVLLESETLGSGSTSKAAGGVRVQHSDELNTRIVLRSIQEFQSFEERTGVPSGFQQVGYLFAINSASDLERFRASAAAQRALGAPTEILGVDGIRELLPGLSVDDLVGASFCPIEGYAVPESVVQGYASAARRGGGRIETNAPVLEILCDSVGVSGVRTSREIIRTRRVVIAAGVQSRDLAASVGLDLPVSAEARTIYFSGNAVGVPARAPLTVDVATNFYFHREGEGLIFSGPEGDLESLSEYAMKRLPSLEDASIQTSWSGNYDMSPDRNAMVGASEISGLFYATGFSGHGFMQSPAVGEHLAELVSDLEPTLDLSQMSARRFAEGVDRVEALII